MILVLTNIKEIERENESMREKEEEKSLLAETIERVNEIRTPKSVVSVHNHPDRAKETTLPRDLKLTPHDKNKLEETDAQQDFEADFEEEVMQPRTKDGVLKKRVSLVEHLKRYLEQHPEEIERVIKSMVAQGKIGNVIAIREILDRIDGKVAETHKFEGQLPIRIEFIPASVILEKQKEPNPTDEPRTT